MTIVTTREFRANQSKFLGMARRGEHVILKSRLGSFRLTPEEEEELIPYMAESSDGGFVLLITTDHNEYGNAESYAGNYYRSQIPDESGVLFLIDLDTRKLLFYSEGEYKRELTSSKMNIIGDNIYKYATNGDFYTCAREAFTQVSDVLEGRRISARMKYISNACLAILLALIINYFIARAVSGTAKPSDESIVDSLYSQFSFTDPNVTFLHESRKYSPRSSGSGGSGGGVFESRGQVPRLSESRGQVP